ncbi:HTH-type transcriptional regulator / antitoxin HigA [Tessaracoccus bendigoensis DSM 12906]|uniref:HTH-type transcriptional regulator / antitoxin HigA n=1 Tax=Tessaracoccus bendigoensis DSM 12906 TaxID=1123357 RepID=A0A1M6MAY7_9ACTN|nr:HTH-type transcriptional regulator / antitoxin HigA [Tessaracoccus bendigoensis DSM 12906]
MDRNYAVAPGEYLAEWLEEERFTQQQLADRLGWSRKRVNEIVGGRAPVSAEAAIQLERVTGIPSDSWLRFETAYRSDLARLHDVEQLQEEAVDARLAKYLRALGATKATARNRAQLVSDLLRFHRCGTVAAYRDLVAEQFRGEFQLAALKESADAVDHALLMAWLRAGELTPEYEAARTLAYDAEGLRTLLPELRRRVAIPDARMDDDVRSMLRTVGVTLQLVDPPSGLPLHGVTHWIDGRYPLIQQTGRRGTDGFIIWTLFHELGHLLGDPRGETHLVFTSSKSRNSHAEKQANRFALETLFGESGLEPFKGLERDNDIRRVAEAVGISPGLAVFQMHRTRLLDYNRGNQLCVDLRA